MRAKAASLTNINKYQANLRRGGCRYIAIMFLQRNPVTCTSLLFGL